MRNLKKKTKMLTQILAIYLVFCLHEVVFSQQKDNIECWIFLPPLTHFYACQLKCCEKMNELT